METGQPKHILVAANPKIRDTLSYALQALDVALTYCSTVEEAKLLLVAQHFDLILSTLQFDKSRLFDLLRYVKKENPRTASIPFVALKVASGILPESLIESSLKSAKLLGADESVNLPVWRRDLGDEAAIKQLCETISRLL